MGANQITHDKKKKTVYYDNAVIKIYDIPIFYIPKLSHPDPTVDRRSGFLTPSFLDTKNLGSGLTIPYFWASSADKNFTLDELVLDLERIREKTKFEKAHFAGHSLGGMIAPAYALKFPEHTISVGLLSTVAGRSEEDSKKVWNVIHEMEKNGIEQTLQTLTNRWFTDEFIKNNPDLVERRLKQVVDTDPEVFLNVFKIYAKTEMIPWLKNISKPCLLLTGEHDGGCSPKHNKIMANEIKDSKLVILPKYKHSFLIEAPDEVAESLIEFINE